MKKATLLASLAFLVVLMLGCAASVGCLENNQHGAAFIVFGLLNFGVSGLAAYCAYNAIRAKFDPDFKKD